MMAPVQNEAGAHPVGLPHPPDNNNFRDDNNVEDVVFPGSEDEDEVDGRRDDIHPRRNHPVPPPPPQQQQRQPVPQPQPPPPPLSPQELTRLSEISAKFESIGVDLVRRIVVAPPFPPANYGVTFINLLWTDRETLTMRRLVGKALHEKSYSFNATIFMLPHIPTLVEELRDVFGAVVDRMIYVDGVTTNVTWAKVVTAYAFGLRLVKASVDLGRERRRIRRPEADDEARPDVEEAAAADLDPREWGTALGSVMHERMGAWVLSRGGWSDGFNDYFFDRRGLEELFYVFAAGVGMALLFKFVRS